LTVHVDAVVGDASFNTRTGNQVVHSIEAPQQRGLAATRRTNQGGYLSLVTIQIHILHGLEIAVVHVHCSRREHRVPQGAIGW